MRYAGEPDDYGKGEPVTGVPTLASIIGISLTLIGAIAGFASLWGAMRTELKNLREKVECLESRQDAQGVKTEAGDKELAVVVSRLDRMEKSLESVNAKLDRLLDRQASGRDV